LSDRVTIKLYRDNGHWIAASEHPDLMAQGATRMVALASLALLLDVEADVDLQQEIFGY